MKKTKGFLLAVAVAAMTFIFSCSSDDDKDAFPSCSELPNIALECDEYEYTDSHKMHECYQEKICGNNSAEDCDEFMESCGKTKD